MTLARAASYRLFAGQGEPRRSLTCRIVLFVSGLVAMATLLAYITPAMPGLDEVRISCLAFAVVSMVVGVVYLSTAYIQQAVMHRLRVFFYMPVRIAVVRRLFWMAYVPAIAASAAIAIPLVWRLFSGSPSNEYAFMAGSSAFVTSVILHTMLRITATSLSPAVGMISVGSVIGMAWVAWQTIGTDGRAGLYGAAGYALAATILSWYLFRAPLAARTRPVAPVVWEWKELGFLVATWVRALRTSRYTGANAFLLLLCGGLSCIAWREPAFSFDAVCVLTLLLAGTLGQEARSLSRAQYPLEMVWYGRQGMWLSSAWLLAVINAAFFTDLLLIIAIVWFPHGVGIDYMQAAAIGVGLVGVAILAASLVVPRKDDILAQLLSTVMYGVLAWIVFRSITGHTVPMSLLVTTMGFVSCLALSFWCEHVRWMLTTRGKYGVYHAR